MGIDEIFTGVVGFAIAMAIVGAVVGGVLYGYYAYVHNQVLANYLWPVVDVVPNSSGYYMAVINTGHEPLFVKYIIYPNGQSQNVNSGVLYQNQYWMTTLQSMPAAVMVCSAINPNVCVMAKVSGYTVLGGGSDGGVEVVVNDPYNATWVVEWGYPTSLFPYIAVKSTSYKWYINPPYLPIVIGFVTYIAHNPNGYICSIKPSPSGYCQEYFPGAWACLATYYPGNVQEFTVTCNSTQQSQSYWSFPPPCIPPLPPPP